MKKLTACLCTLLLLLCLTACAPWDDAVALVNGWTDPTPTPTSEAPESAPQDTPQSTPDDRPVIDALGIVVAGSFSSVPDRSIAGWLEEYLPGGDWSCNQNTVEYYATAAYYGRLAEIHFSFSVDPDSRTFTLDACRVDRYDYYEDEMPELAQQLIDSAARAAEEAAAEESEDENDEESDAS